MQKPLRLTQHMSRIDQESRIGKDVGTQLETLRDSDVGPIGAACRGETALLETLTGDSLEYFESMILSGAAWFGHVGVIEWMMERDTPLVGYTRDNGLPLRRAAERNHYEIVRYMLTHMREPNDDDARKRDLQIMQYAYIDAVQAGGFEAAEVIETFVEYFEDWCCQCIFKAVTREAFLDGLMFLLERWKPERCHWLQALEIARRDNQADMIAFIETWLKQS